MTALPNPQKPDNDNGTCLEHVAIEMDWGKNATNHGKPPAEQLEKISSLPNSTNRELFRTQ